MVESTVQRLVEEAHRAHLEGSGPGSSLARSMLVKSQERTFESIVGAMVTLGFGLGFLTISFNESWVTRSPMFTVTGAVLCFLLLVFCWILGMVVWVVTGSEVLCVFATDFLPFGVQPYRSAAGVVVFVVALVIIVAKLSSRYGWTFPAWGNSQAILSRARYAFWFLATVTFLAAFVLFVVNGLKEASAIQQPPACTRESLQEEIEVAQSDENRPEFRVEVSSDRDAVNIGIGDSVQEEDYQEVRWEKTCSEQQKRRREVTDRDNYRRDRASSRKQRSVRVNGKYVWPGGGYRYGYKRR